MKLPPIISKIDELIDDLKNPSRIDFDILEKVFSTIKSIQQNHVDHFILILIDKIQELITEVYETSI